MVSLAALTLVSALLVAAQQSLSAKAGVISYASGEVSIGDQKVVAGRGRSSLLSAGESLRSGAGGRAEVILNPCVTLHLDENSSLRMVTSSFDDARVELISGSAILRADGILRNTKVMVVVGDAVAPMSWRGIFRFDAAPPRLKVFLGKVAVQRSGGPITLTSGHVAPLTGSAAAQKFEADPREDAFGRWSERRAETLLRESGYNPRAEWEREQQERAWSHAEANGTLPPGSRPPAPKGPTTGRLGFCAEKSVR